jgi:NAD(P)-dependent dehydrogenase (short-subunit alcohol dehydrogenase family)
MNGAPNEEGPMQRVEDRVAVVTGAASGIGLGIARAFAAAGMKVVLADVREEPLEQAAAELRDGGGSALAVRADVSRLDEVEALAAVALAEFGAVHVLCNNAGVGLFTRIADTTIDDWRWTLEIDLWGPIHGVKTFLPIIEREDEGHINSTSSMAGLLAVPRLGAYNVAKHGVVALMATLERELRAAHSPVRTSVLCPGAVNTGILANSVQNRRQATGSADNTPESVGAIGTGAEPDDVGRLVLDAIRNDRFWIFTAPELVASLQQQVADMAEEQSLSRLRLG